MEQWGLAVACVLALVVVLVGVGIVDGRLLTRSAPARTIALDAAVAAAGAVPWLVLAPLARPWFDLPQALYPPIAVLAAIAAFLACVAPRSMGAGWPATLTFSFVWSAVVFVPAALASFGSPAVLDHGGSLAVNVAPGAAALGMLLLGGGRTGPVQPMPLWLGAVGVAAVVAGWIGWLAASELAIDEATPGILAAGALGAAGGLAGWLIVQRVRHQATTLDAVAAGLISGVVAITAGAPLFTPASAAVTGLIAGGAAGLLTMTRASASGRPQWAIAGTHLVGAGIGLIVLGIAGTAVGFVFTGQPVLAATQTIAVLAAAAWSAVVAALLWLPVRRRVRTG